MKDKEVKLSESPSKRAKKVVEKRVSYNNDSTSASSRDSVKQ